jgi:hypothetical protein
MSTTPNHRLRRALAGLAIAPLVLAAAACGAGSYARSNDGSMRTTRRGQRPSPDVA